MPKKETNQICIFFFLSRYPVVIKIQKLAITSCARYSFRIHEANTSMQKTRLETRRPSNSKKIGPCKCVSVSAMIPRLLLSSLPSSGSTSSEADPWAFRRCLMVFFLSASFRMSSVHFSISPACVSR